MAYRFVTCALCGHQNPILSYRGSRTITCGCGLHIECADAPQERRARNAAMIAMVAVLALLAAAFLYWQG